jgi:hypothetical protein
MVTFQSDLPAVVPSDSTRAFGPAITINDAMAAWQINGWQDLSPSNTPRYSSIWSTHIKGSIGKRA